MKFMSNWIKQRKLLSIILIVIIVGGIYWYTQGSKSSNQTTQYQTDKAEKGTLVLAISGSGQVSTANSTSIKTELGGRIQEVYVKSGDYVQAGTPLAKIELDNDSLQKQSETYASYLSALNQARQAQISKSSNQVSLESARQAVLEASQNVSELDTNLSTDSINPATREKYTQNEIDIIRSKLTQARSSFAIAEQKYKAADTSIFSANASLVAAKIKYENQSNVITAPVAGTISNFTLQKGDSITVETTTSNSTTTASTKIATLNTGTKPSIVINVSEVDIPAVGIGNKVTFTVDAFPEKTFTGTVTDIDTTGSITSGVVSYPVTIVSDTEINQLYANMSVTANIITQTKDNVLLIPASAIQRTDDQTIVRVMRNGKVETVTVETGDASDTQVEITSGLAEGDEVVTSTVTTGSANSQQRTSVFGMSAFGGGGTRNAVRIQSR